MYTISYINEKRTHLNKNKVPKIEYFYVVLRTWLRIDEIASPPMRCAHVTDRRSREVDHDRHWHILLAYISYLVTP